ncbi:unnamed protein product [Cylicocyclus nassatus]|uniref:C2H2-type domain-containing protein n=1 Tax=Cylicocyclus nassatus TaxID=53992 RepID=A0AA36GPN2_CYLNA|nr:unnamed protein product [Cylicocyclus nassatus]
MSTICPSPSTPAFDLASFLSGALQLKRESQFMNGFGTFPTTPDILLGHNPISPVSPGSEGRKRRRGEVRILLLSRKFFPYLSFPTNWTTTPAIFFLNLLPLLSSNKIYLTKLRNSAANPANTLDGLVARRADDTHEPFQKRYLSEQEAIEGPDDEAEAKRMEKDPDVSTRTCSTCGYVGKWISEMIRHKRVHTNERPFKCRYCSRTSKWKADLIRHVAKTHGIRVVSKYSRSKAFDQTVTNLTNRDDDDKPRVYACEPDKVPERQKQLHSLQVEANPELARPEPLLPDKAPLSYRCSSCFFEQAGLSVLVHHLRTMHDKSPYECRCQAVFESIGDALNHATLSENCTSDDLILNVVPIYNNRNASMSSSESMSPTRYRSDSSPDSGVQGDLEDVEAGRTSATISKCTGDSESENTNNLLSSSSLYATSAASFLPSMDISTALLALQLPFMSDYLATMTSLMTTPPITPVAKPLAYKCAQCGMRLADVLAFVAHSRVHASSVLPLVDSNIVGGFAVQHDQKDEVVDVEM